MNFESAIAAGTAEDRKQLIEDEVYANNWSELLEDEMTEGEPDDVRAERIRITESKANINVDVDLEFNESVPTLSAGCNLGHAGRANFEIVIDRKTGQHTLKMKDSAIQSNPNLDDPDDDEFPDIQVDGVTD